MNIIVLGVLIIGFIIAKFVYDKLTKQKKIVNNLIESYGKEWNEEISYEREQTIPCYYESICDVKYDIDSITWNDLDLQALYLEMNRTESAIGEEYLYALLHKPIIDKEKWNERNRLIELFDKDEEVRLSIGRIFHQMGKLKNISVYEYLNMLDACESDSSLKHIFSILILLLSVGITIYNPLIGFMCILASIAYNMISYYSQKNKIGKYYNVLMFILRVLYGAKKLANCEIASLSEYQENAKKVLSEYRGFQRGSFLIVSNVDGGSFFDIIMDYIRMLFHVDLIKFNQMVRVIKNKKKSLYLLYENIGVLDAMRAVSSYRAYLGRENYSTPHFTEEGLGLSIKGLYHPLLTNPVKADLIESSSVLLTGSNASGKSTFLKAVAINALFSQTICTAMANEYCAPRFKIFSSMALSDNLFENESYFIVEIKSLKRIIDAVESEVPMLCFIDEVLRGTNTLERIAASSQILKDLSKENVICFSATHDIELTHILENYYKNYHFTEDVVDGEVLFEYKLHKGRATSRNAIKLLSMLGYEDKIVKSAELSANRYMQEGQWKIFE